MALPSQSSQATPWLSPTSRPPRTPLGQERLRLARRRRRGRQGHRPSRHRHPLHQRRRVWCPGAEPLRQHTLPPPPAHRPSRDTPRCSALGAMERFERGTCPRGERLRGSDTGPPCGRSAPTETVSFPAAPTAASSSGRPTRQPPWSSCAFLGKQCAFARLAPPSWSARRKASSSASTAGPGSESGPRGCSATSAPCAASWWTQPAAASSSFRNSVPSGPFP